MMASKDNQSDSAELRKRAEEIARQKTAQSPEDLAAMSPEEIRRMLHELRVHQIELEIQNEELRRAQDELDASRARYFDLYDLAPVGYFTISEKGLILEANLTAATLLNVVRGTLVKQPISSFIFREDQDVYYRHRRQLFETGEPQVCELRMVRADSPPFWVRLDAIAVRDEDGAPVSHCAMSDITDRKQAEQEREKLQAQLNQARKMESVGRLARGVAHDFNNMLSVIIGNTELAMGNLGPDDPVRDALQEIFNAAEHSAEVTRQLLAFARKQVISPKVLDLNETVEGMLKMLRRLIGEDIDLSWLPATNVWPVRMDPSQIDQILVNLCANGRDAIAGVGKVTIETANVSLDESYCADHDGFVPGDFVLLAVSDDGCGMDRKTLDNLFEPFFTTKGVDQGTGLGLAMIYGIVKQNNGFINVDSEPEKGSTFRIYLPRYEITAEPTRKKIDPVAPDAQGGETILLVEDDSAVLKISRRMLEHLGYTVLTATTPGEAIRLAEVYRGKILLLLTDVILPEINGRDLADKLLSLYPHLKCLFMSGYSANLIADGKMLEMGVHFIQKPFSIKELAIKVRQVLGGEWAPMVHD